MTKMKKKAKQQKNDPMDDYDDHTRYNSKGQCLTDDDDDE